MPARVLLTKETPRPKYREDVTEYQGNEHAEPSELFARIHPSKILGTADPDVAPDGCGGERLDRELAEKQVHPIRLELRGGGVQARAPGVNLLVYPGGDHQHPDDPADNHHKRGTNPVTVSPAGRSGARLRNAGYFRGVQ